VTNQERITLVIPAAGKGTRLLRGAGSIPKGMITIHDRPLVEHVLETGLQLPVSRIVIVISPAGESIRRYLGNMWRGRGIQYVVQPEPRGIADAVSLAEPYVERCMLVINGDEVFVGGCCGDTYSYFRNKKANGVVGYIRTTPGDPRIRLGYGLELGSDQKVHWLVEKPVSAWNDLLGVGFWLLDRSFFACLSCTPVNKDRGERDFVRVIEAMIADGLAIYGMDLKALFVNVNTPQDILKAETVLQTKATMPTMRASFPDCAAGLNLG
jgi:dTDP-glucose pyrophosphorylase